VWGAGLMLVKPPVLQRKAAHSSRGTGARSHGGTLARVHGCKLKREGAGGGEKRRTGEKPYARARQGGVADEARGRGMHGVRKRAAMLLRAALDPPPAVKMMTRCTDRWHCECPPTASSAKVP
jgi:hypothetical protein